MISCYCRLVLSGYEPDRKKFFTVLKESSCRWDYLMTLRQTLGQNAGISCPLTDMEHLRNSRRFFHRPWEKCEVLIYNAWTSPFISSVVPFSKLPRNPDTDEYEVTVNE